MSGIDVGEEPGARAAQARALALLRIRSRALAVAILPAAVAVVLFAADAQGHLAGPAWDAVRWTVLGVAVVVLLVTVLVAVSVARARPAMSPTVPVPEEGAPDLYRLVRDLADRLDVPAPSAIALTPDCDSWLEDRTHRALRKRSGPSLRKGPDASAGSSEAADTAPVLVIGSPFLWWMRVAELRAVLAPVVAGTGPSAHPDIAAARRFVRGLDAAVADGAAPGKGPLRAAPAAFTGWVARLLLRACRGHAAEMERCVAAAASMRAQTVDYGLRIAAQEQVGLAYAGWDRLLTRVALPAWRMGRWPSRLDAGVVSALTELSRRDRLADGFALRLGERPACDLLEEPGVADEAASLLAARLFHGGPAESGPGWAPVDWQQYPDEVVDRKWRSEAARLHRVLDTLGAPRASAADPAVPTLARVMEHLSGAGGPGGPGEALAAGIGAAVAREEAESPGHGGPGTGDAAHGGGQGHGGAGSGGGQADDPLDLWGPGPLPLFPLQPPRTGTELLADHVAAMVCCAAVDTAGAAPGLDWLDGPALLVGGERRADLAAPVLSLVEDGDPDPLLSWLAEVGVRSDKPVRLV
ncbi:hypothetical protein [Streptomyces sp. PTY087I2]|uniref:hypothetical protein n=1 Tax=Streptomyces sp. PTY087I2 TaxID=1819298 RepID=UPI00080B3B19|nr:hypothetical protein [Streptomyces sp. PTY087I2]OCC07790.1 hypothetical protein A3Q37_06377 [Streptomyces sp. PTY087I2]